MSIEAIGAAVPQHKETAAEIAAATGAEEAFVRDKVGVHQRYILRDGETGVELAAAAVEDLVANSALNLKDVGLLVFVTQNPDRRIPHNAGILAHRLGLRQDLASFDISLGCSGFVYGLSVTEAMLAAQNIDNALLVTCDPYSRIMDAADKNTNAVFGDAAAATWVSRTGTRTRLIGMDFGTDGAGGDAIRVEAGGAAAPLVSLDVPEGVTSYERGALRLHMDGRDVFNFVNGTMPGSFKQSLAKADMEMSDIDWFALHQGSAYMLQTLARRCRIPLDKLCMNIDRYGNTVSSTIPLLLKQLSQDEDLSGQRVMISGFGVGLSWATGVLEFQQR